MGNAAAAAVDGAQGNAETAAAAIEGVGGTAGGGAIRRYVAGGEGLGLGGGREGLPPGFLMDDYASLEAVEHLVREAERRGEYVAAAAAAAAASATAANGGGFESGFGGMKVAEAAPATPLECLLRLIWQLADGGKVSVEQALAALNGDGHALGRLVSISPSR